MEVRKYGKVFRHVDTNYEVLDVKNLSNFADNLQNVDKEKLKEFRDLISADKVVKVANKFVFLKDIEDAVIIEECNIN